MNNPPDRANNNNRKLSRPDTAYNFMQYTGPEDYTEDEHAKSLELIKSVTKMLQGNQPRPWDKK